MTGNKQIKYTETVILTTFDRFSNFENIKTGTNR